VPALDLQPDASDAGEDLRAVVRDLTERLERERARNAGLERGLTALSEQVERLRDENAELRGQLDRRARLV
jgi:cell division protein FtsB